MSTFMAKYSFFNQYYNFLLQFFIKQELEENVFSTALPLDLSYTNVNCDNTAEMMPFTE
jgi:hypothetical protein